MIIVKIRKILFYHIQSHFLKIFIEMHIENNRDHFINLCAYCQCCTILVAVNVTVYVNVTRFPGQNLAVFCTFRINVACPMSCTFVGF